MMRNMWCSASMCGMLIAVSAHPAAPAPATPTAPQYELQYDISGHWTPIIHEDGNNRDRGGVFEIHAGLPLNDAAISRYESFNEDQTAQSEFQCRRFTTPYSTRTAHANLVISAEMEPVSSSTGFTIGRIVAYKLHYQHNGRLQGGTRTVYVDGRPAPGPLARHSFEGFATGKWEGDMLRIEITHLKAYYLQRPGVPASDQRTVTERLVRHGDYLTMIQETRDPVFLTEPLVWTFTWARNDGPLPPNPEAFCHAQEELPYLSIDSRRVPFYLPGTSPANDFVANKYGMPMEIVRASDGAAMMYPEYRQRMKQTASSLERCVEAARPLGALQCTAREE